MPLGAVADDFTGATDLATALRTRGFRTAVVVGDLDVPPSRLEACDAVVIALKSRTAPVAEAVAASEAAVSRLLAWGADRFYVKYCSTFDSTDAGNIGPVLDAVARAVGADRAVVVPAFPQNGRTVREGRLYVGDDLLEDSPMRHHPLTPMRRSRVRDLLAPQTRTPITEIALPVVRRGVDALRDALDSAPAGYLVDDEVDGHDLAVIARASAHHCLVSGGAGLAVGLEAPSRAPADPFPRMRGGRLVVCGSASEVTRGQIAHAVGAGHPARKVDVAAAVADPARETAALAAWVRAQPDDRVPVVYSVGDADDIVPRDRAAAAAHAVEAVLAALVADLTGDGRVDRVVVAGGETSGAVVQALGVDVLDVGPQLDPGLCWTAGTTAAGREVALVLKSGNFGAVDLFSTAWEAAA
jgi:uncharacterized protein YgbK (DUF1537 family)